MDKQTGSVPSTISLLQQIFSKSEGCARKLPSCSLTSFSLLPETIVAQTGYTVLYFLTVLSLSGEGGGYSDGRSYSDGDGGSSSVGDGDSYSDGAGDSYSGEGYSGGAHASYGGGGSRGGYGEARGSYGTALAVPAIGSSAKAYDVDRYSRRSR